MMHRLSGYDWVFHRENWSVGSDRLLIDRTRSRESGQAEDSPLLRMDSSNWVVLSNSSCNRRMVCSKEDEDQFNHVCQIPSSEHFQRTNDQRQQAFFLVFFVLSKVAFQLQSLAIEYQCISFLDLHRGTVLHWCFLFFQSNTQLTQTRLSGIKISEASYLRTCRDVITASHQWNVIKMRLPFRNRRENVGICQDSYFLV